MRHAGEARRIPLARLGKSAAMLPGDKTATIITVCALGNISIQGMLYLKSLGYQNAKSLSGGTTAWAERGLPTEPRV